MTKYPKNSNRGVSIAGFVVLLALVPLIAWSLNFIIKRDFGETPISKSANYTETTQVAAVIATTSPAIATTSATTTPKTPIAISTTTPTKSVPPMATTTPAKQQETKPENPVSNKTVTLTDDGFSPSSITVARGQSITFVNNSKSKMWVAANPFPSSSEYPDFNQKEGVDSGESWSFTFDQAGTWFYHNHYSPATGAKVVVSWK